MQIRNTNQRKIIMDIMQDNYSHPTADEIYEAARKIDSHISRGTVYRNLAFLAEQGSILKISVPDGSDHYDSTLKEHYHFCCKNCSKMYDLPDTAKVELSAAIQNMTDQGFKISEHNLIVFGLCPSCNV